MLSTSIKHVKTMFSSSLFCPIYSIDVLIIIFSAPDQAPDGSMIGGGRKLKPLQGNAIGLNMTRFVLLNFYKFVRISFLNDRTLVRYRLMLALM